MRSSPPSRGRGYSAPRRKGSVLSILLWCFGGQRLTFAMSASAQPLTALPKRANESARCAKLLASFICYNVVMVGRRRRL